MWTTLLRPVMTDRFGGSGVCREAPRADPPMEQAFVIMQIGNRALDRVYEHAIVPALRACGLEARRVDRHNRGGLLASEIIAFIETCAGTSASACCEIRMCRQSRRKNPQAVEIQTRPHVQVCLGKTQIAEVGIDGRCNQVDPERPRMRVAQGRKK